MFLQLLKNWSCQLSFLLNTANGCGLKAEVAELWPQKMLDQIPGQAMKTWAAEWRNTPIEIIDIPEAVSLPKMSTLHKKGILMYDMYDFWTYLPDSSSNNS